MRCNDCDCCGLEKDNDVRWYTDRLMFLCQRCRVIRNNYTKKVLTKLQRKFKKNNSKTDYIISVEDFKKFKRGI